MIDLEMEHIEFLKCLIDQCILETAEEFEYPIYFRLSDISREGVTFLQEKGLIGWHDGWHISHDGEKAYHDNKHKLPYHQLWKKTDSSEEE